MKLEIKFVLEQESEKMDFLGIKEIGMDGDAPCGDCGTTENIVWWTDNVFWNNVMGRTEKICDETAAILCPQCFVKRAEAKYQPTGWRLIPEFEWTHKKSPNERA